MEDEGDIRRRPGRQRDPTVRQAILEAALGLAKEQPYAAVTMEGIAARAGVGKQTLYRWWPSRAEILLEALCSLAVDTISVPATGNLRGDVEAFLRSTFRILRTEVGRVVRLLMAEAQQDSRFAALFQKDFIAVRRADLLRLLREDGLENPDLAADILYGVMWYRLLSGHAPLDDALAEELALRVVALSEIDKGTSFPAKDTPE